MSDLAFILIENSIFDQLRILHRLADRSDLRESIKQDLQQAIKCNRVLQKQIVSLWQIIHGQRDADRDYWTRVLSEVLDGEPSELMQKVAERNFD